VITGSKRYLNIDDPLDFTAKKNRNTNT